MTFSGEAMRTFITLRDQKVMLRVNRWYAPRWIRVWMICATRGGDGWLWYALGLVLLLFGGEQRFLAVGSGALAASTGIALFLKLKKAAHRRRPSEPHCWASLLPPDQFSFPSGHTITAFAVSISLAAYYPELGVGLLFCAASVAASRILLGMHFLSDVLAGAAIGALLATGASHLVRLL
ncbi:MAG: phosphatase PAP2 family protein [Bryobacteraceae bacterium]